MCEEKKLNFKEKKEEIAKKYEKLVGAISELEDVDMGVALDMCFANVEVKANYGFRKMEEDVAELNEIARKQVNG